MLRAVARVARGRMKMVVTLIVVLDTVRWPGVAVFCSERELVFCCCSSKGTARGIYTPALYRRETTLYQPTFRQPVSSPNSPLAVTR
jgi:hypothetical protein